MASFMSYFGRRDPKQSAGRPSRRRDHLQKKIDQELKIAKANAVSNKPLATAALKRKRMNETQLDQLRGQQMQLAMQVDTLENANLNKETMDAMKKAAQALSDIHSGMTVTKVDQTMAEIQEQREVAQEITDLISNPMGMDSCMQQESLEAELAAMEDEALTERLIGADHVPVHVPEGARPRPVAAVQEDDEEAALRQLQAELAM
ncbi:vacuolar-sorting protein SNF7 [Mycena olivaceomarginata]|nr:vacuolar-sorting protein SNF7 [Mycena olivaceomarginata]